MGPLNSLEKMLDETFNKIDLKLPKNAKDWIVKYSPWFALVGGVVQLLVGLSLFNWARKVNDVADVVNSYARAFGVKSAEYHLGVAFYVSIIVLIGSAVTLLLAYPGLKAQKKAGWNFLFYGSLLNAVYGLAYMFVDGRGSVGSFIGSLVGSLVGLWFLFQVRSYYLGASAKKVSEPTTPAPKA